MRKLADIAGIISTIGMRPIAVATVMAGIWFVDNSRATRWQARRSMPATAVFVGSIAVVIRTLYMRYVYGQFSLTPDIHSMDFKLTFLLLVCVVEFAVCAYKGFRYAYYHKKLMEAPVPAYKEER